MAKSIVFIVLHLGTGGAEKVITNVANLLSEDNKVKIISTYKLAEKPSFSLNENIEIEYLLENLKPNREELINAIKKINIFLVLKEMVKTMKILFLRKYLVIKKLKKLNCDMVISTRNFHNKLVGKYANKKIIKIAQEHNHHNNNERYIKKLIKSLKNIDCFMPVSIELAHFYKEKVNCAVKYIPNFIENIPSKSCNLDSKQVIAVGRLEKVKGFDDLIDIFDCFVKKHSDWVLHIVGDGTEKENLKNKIRNLGLEEKIKLCGTKIDNDLQEEYLNSSLYIMTSYSESFGLVLVEAASYGIPLLAFDSAQGAKEIIKNDLNGFLIENRDYSKFIEKMNKIVEDNEFKKLLSCNAKITSKMFSKEVVLEKWKNFLNEIKK